MTSDAFCLGDRVVAVTEINGCVLEGRTGTVCHMLNNDGNIGVCWDLDEDEVDFALDEGMHTCCDHCEDGYGWYVLPEDIALHNEARDFEDFELSAIDILFA